LLLLPLLLATLFFLPSRAASVQSTAVLVRGIGYGIISEPWNRDMVADLGFTWTKYLVYWKDAQPRKGGALDFHFYDDWVDSARAKGLRVIIRVDDPPSWATGTTAKNAPPINDSDLADFMYQLVAHFRGRVDAWELWSEPNLNYEWGFTRPDPARFARMLQAVYPRVKAADPQALLIVGGLSTAGGDFNDTGNDDHIGDLGYLTLLARAGAQGYFDAIGTHPYGGPYPPEQDYDIDNTTTPVGLYFRRAELQHQAWLQATGQDMPFWATEFGWIQDFGWNCTWADAGIPYGRQAQKVTPQQQADYLVRAYQYAQANWPWMGPMVMYDLDKAIDTPEACDNNYDRFFGIVKPDGSPSPAYTALKAMSKVDNVPPISSVTSLPAYSTSSFSVQWSGVDNPAGTGLKSFDVQRRQASDPWADVAVGTADTSTSVTGREGQTLSFRVRAVDNAGNWESFRSDEGDISTTVDTLPPISAVLPYSMPVTSTLSFPVSWGGTDAGSGIASYDVQYRDGQAYIWTDLFKGTTLTQTTFYNGQNRHTYYFRARAKDRLGIQEDYPQNADSQMLVTTSPYITTTGAPELTLMAPWGRTTTVPQTLSFSNLGASSTGWQAAATAPWLSISPASGVLSPGGTATVAISASPPVTGTGSSRLSASVVITGTSAWNSPITVAATLYAVDSLQTSYLPLALKQATSAW